MSEPLRIMIEGRLVFDKGLHAFDVVERDGTSLHHIVNQLAVSGRQVLGITIIDPSDGYDPTEVPHR